EIVKPGKRKAPGRSNYPGSGFPLRVLGVSGLTLQERVAVLVRVARNRQLIADGLTVNISDVANLGHLAVAHVQVRGILAVEHRDNELTMREDLAVPLHRDGAALHDHVIVTE